MGLAVAQREEIVAGDVVPGFVANAVFEPADAVGRFLLDRADLLFPTRIVLGGFPSGPQALLMQLDQLVGRPPANLAWIAIVRVGPQPTANRLSVGIVGRGSI